MPLSMDTAHKLRVTFRILAANKERGGNAMVTKDVENLPGKRRDRPVIKGEGHSSALLRAPHQRGTEDLRARYAAGIPERDTTCSHYPAPDSCQYRPQHLYYPVLPSARVLAEAALAVLLLSTHPSPNGDM